MPNMSNLSKAIVLYTGRGITPWPRVDAQRLVNEFGADEAAKLEPQIVSLIREMHTIDIDWSVHSLVSAGKLIHSIMQTRHPDLSEDALSALEWKFTFDVK